MNTPTLPLRHLPAFLMQCLVKVLLLTAAGFCLAQPAGLLYDPEPPANSAYVRVLNAAQPETVSVWVDKSERVKQLLANHASDYLVIPSGLHEFSLSVKGKKTSAMSLDIAPGKILTLAFLTKTAADQAVVFEDQTSKNKLKAMLHVYQLAYKTYPVDITTSNFETKVFSNLAFKASNHIQVNPISINLFAVKTGTKLPLLDTSLSMNQGSAYSLFLLTDHQAKPFIYAIENKIERFTGK